MRKILLAAIVVLVTARAFAQGVPVVGIPRIDVMPDDSGAPSIAQISPDRTVVAWCAAEEQKIAIYASGVIPRLGSVDDHPERVAEVSGLTMVQPLVAAMGEGYVVVWPEVDGVHAVVQRSSGSKYIPPQPLIASAVPLAVATVFNETALVFAVQSTAPRNEWRIGVAFLTDTAGLAKLEWIDTLPTQPHAALAPTGEGFLLAYSERQQSSPMLVRSVTLDSVSSATSLGDAGTSDSLAIATSPDGALAIWAMPGFGNDFVARHLDLNGHPTGEAFRIIPGGSHPDVAWDGSNYLLTYSAAGEVRIAYATESSTSLERDSAVGPGSESRVVSDGSTSTVTWTHPSEGNRAASHGTIEAAGIDSSGGVISTMTVSHNFAREDQPAAAAAGDVTLVAWTEQTGPDARSVFATRIDRDGRSLDASAISLYDGRIQGAPAVASNGTEFLVVWPEYDPASNSSRVIGQRIPSAGAADALGGPFEIAAAPDYTTEVTVVWNGENYLVAWPMSYTENPLRGIETALVLSTGVVRTRKTVRFPDGGGVVRDITIAAGTTGFLMTADMITGGPIATENAFVTALDRSAEVIAPPALIATNAMRPAVAALDDRFLVVWSDSELPKLLGRYYDGSANSVSDVFTIYGARVARVPTVVSDGTGFVVAFDPGEFTHTPLLATIRGGDVTGISIASEPSVRNDPATVLVARTSGLLSVFRAFDETWTNVARVYTRSVPGSGAVDVAVDLVAPAETHAGAVVQVRLGVSNVGSQPTTAGDAHFRAYGNRIASFPYGCQADPFFVNVICPVPELQPGSTVFYYFDVEIDADAAPIEAKAFAHEQDPATANNFATATVKMTGTSRRRSTRR